MQYNQNDNIGMGGETKKNCGRLVENLAGER
jgi:hypothetical protein